MDNATCIPSRTLRLPPPLLPPAQPHRGRWAAVVPSPDRSALLLRNRHECQLASVAAFTRPLGSTAPSTPSSAQTRPHGQPPPPSSLSASCAPMRASCRVLLPQPHRALTASCWLSTGMDAASNAVVALGDACASLTVMRVPHPAAAATGSSTGAWAQTTLFLYDDTAGCDDIADLFAYRKRRYVEASTTGPPQHQQQQQRSRRLESAALGTMPPSTTPGWKAVTAVVPCNYVALHQPPAEAHLLCQRDGDGVYAGSGVAGAGAGRASARAAAWMAAVQRESAWRVPLAMPPGEEAVAVDEYAGLREREWGTACGGAAAAAASGTATTAATASRLRVAAELTHCKTEGEHDGGGEDGGRRVRRPLPPDAPRPRSASPLVRLHDVRRRPSAAVGPLGLVVAAAMRRHVGLYTTAGTSVAPTVFFPLPADLDRHPPPDSLHRPSRHSTHSSWRVASVLEAPAAVPASNGFSYLVTLTAGGGVGGGTGARRGACAATAGRWWLLYDCRNPSAPVWAADAAGDVWAGSGGNVDDDLDHEWGDAAMHVEWLASAGPALCAAYVPGPSTVASESRGAGACVVLDGALALLRHADGGGAPNLGDSDADGAEEGEGDAWWWATAGDNEDGAVASTADSTARTDEGEVQLPAPITYELSPPRSTVGAAEEVGSAGAGAATSSPTCVRALTYLDGVLHYVCDDAAV